MISAEGIVIFAAIVVVISIPCAAIVMLICWRSASDEYENEIKVLNSRIEEVIRERDDLRMQITALEYQVLGGDAKIKV